MKKKFVVIVLIIIMIFLFVTGFVFASRTLNSYREDKKNTKAILNGIVVEYSNFESKIEPYNKKLQPIVELLNKSSYYEKIVKNEKSILDSLNEAKKQIQELDGFSVLKNNCNRKYADGKANRACSSYKKTYEKSINLYVDVVKAYNNIIAKTNEISDNKLSLYDTSFKDYIDYDKDGIFNGKNLILKEKEVLKDE